MSLQFLCHRQRFVGVPTPTLATGLLQGAQVEQPRRAWASMLNCHGKLSLIFHRGTSDRLGQGTISDAMFARRCMTHGKAARRDACSGNGIGIVLRSEVTDFELSKADNTERRGLHAANPDHPMHAVPQRDRHVAVAGC